MIYEDKISNFIVKIPEKYTTCPFCKIPARVGGATPYGSNDKYRQVKLVCTSNPEHWQVWNSSDAEPDFNITKQRREITDINRKSRKRGMKSVPQNTLGVQPPADKKAGRPTIQELAKSLKLYEDLNDYQI